MMNERIQELVEQCYEKHQLLGTYEFNKEKFAELIIAECIKLAVFKGDSITGRVIKEHFQADSDIDPVKKDIRYCLDCLAEFPRVQAEIKRVWGTGQGRSYIYGLIIDDRNRHNSKVMGFPPSVVQVIHTLLEIHDEFYPAFKPTISVWDQKL